MSALQCHYNHIRPFYPSGYARVKTCPVILYSLPRPGVGPRDPSGRCLGHGTPKQPMTSCGITKVLWIGCIAMGIFRVAWLTLQGGPTLTKLRQERRPHIIVSRGKVCQPLLGHNLSLPLYIGFSLPSLDRRFLESHLSQESSLSL